MTSPFYRAFEDRHRGTRELIQQRLQVYLPFIKPLQTLYPECPAMDLGCGRGEWLQVLMEQGFAPLGVDQDEGMLQACHELGLPVERGDALAALAAKGEESLVLVSGFHLAEHVPFPALQKLVSDALHALKPGGLLVLETPNAENLVVGSSNFYLDPTHERPIPYLLLSFLAEHTGFARVKLLRLNEPPSVADSNPVDLMSVLGGASPDYAIVAQKAAPEAQMALFEAAFSSHYGVGLDMLAARYDHGINQRLEALENLPASLEDVQQTANQSLVEVQQLKLQTEDLDKRTELIETMTRRLAISDTYAEQVLKLARQVESTERSLNESLANAHHWWLQAEEYRARLEDIQRSTSWRLTWPLRFIIKALREGTRSPVLIARQMKHALVGSRRRGQRRPGQGKQMFIDISELMQRDARTGIQRVVRSILGELLNNPPAGYEVRPVFGTADGLGYQYVTVNQDAHGFSFTKADFAPIEYHAGDQFLGLDLQHQVVISHAHEYAKMRQAGVKMQFVIYDLLPIFMPNSFWQGAAHLHADWLGVIAQNDGAICISKAVADEYKTWLVQTRRLPHEQLNIGWFHLGADLKSSAPTTGLPENAPAVLDTLTCRPTFLVVGTVEPRKGHAQVVAAFDLLWQKGIDVNLMIVGKQGWSVEPLVEQINTHPEFGKRLIWADSASDEYLEAIYKASTCLVAASEGEGFGLPLIEAAQHEIAIIARDLPVFMEVAGEHAYYFSGKEPAALADAVVSWLEMRERDEIPRSTGMPWLTWEQSTLQLKDVVLNNQWYLRAGSEATPAVSNTGAV